MSKWQLYEEKLMITCVEIDVQDFVNETCICGYLVATFCVYTILYLLRIYICVV